MRDLLSKLDAIVSETELKNPEDLQAKRRALADLEKDPVASEDPEISSAIAQRKTDLEREAKSKGFDESFELDREELKPAHDKGYGDAAKGIDKNPFNPDSPAFKSYREGQMAYKRSFGESFEIGDEFGISFSEDHEIATTIVDILEDGIVIELDDLALEMLTNEGLNFLEGELVEDKQKGVDGKACWKGYKRMGTKQKGGKTVDNCVKMEDHGPENPDAPVNYGEYDREGDMAKDDLRTIDDAAEELYGILQADDNLPEWVQGKITKAVDYLDTARDYMKAQKYEEGSVNQLPTQGADYSKHDTDHLKMMLRPGILHRNEARFKALIRKELQKREQQSQQGVAEGSAHGYNVAKWYEKNGDQKKLTNWLRKEAGLEKNAPLYFDDVDLVHGDETIVPNALINPKLKFNDLLTAVVQATGGTPKQNVDGVYRSQGVEEDDVDEAKYQGREVPLGKKMAGDVKKSKVYVRKPNGNIVKVNFGDKKMRIKKSNPARRKSFRARHNCANPGPRHKARYWSCRSW